MVTRVENSFFDVMGKIRKETDDQKEFINT